MLGAGPEVGSAGSLVLSWRKGPQCAGKPHRAEEAGAKCQSGAGQDPVGAGQDPVGAGGGQGLQARAWAEHRAWGRGMEVWASPLGRDSEPRDRGPRERRAPEIGRGPAQTLRSIAGEGGGALEGPQMSLGSRQGVRGPGSGQQGPYWPRSGSRKHCHQGHIRVTCWCSRGPCEVRPTVGSSVGKGAERRGEGCREGATGQGDEPRRGMRRWHVPREGLTITDSWRMASLNSSPHITECGRSSRLSWRWDVASHKGLSQG